MSKQQSKLACIVLLIIAIIFIVLKIMETSSNEVVETNYIGDMESENQREQEEDPMENEEEAELEEAELEEALEIQTIEGNEIIRVLIKNTGYENISHSNVTIYAEGGLKISYGEEVEIVDAAEWSIDSGDEKLEESSILIEPLDVDEKLTILSIERNYGNPEYYGTLELFFDGEEIVIVNELSLEYYLRGVLPSEMPATYDMEALKAQAVCARSYAYNHLLSYHYPDYQAHIDDSTSYQVYNNLEEAESCNQAIMETEGEKLFYEERVVTAYFFSTSCGYTTDIGAWGGDDTEVYGYLKSVAVSDGTNDYEEALPWYQWSISISEEELLEILEENLQIVIGALDTVQIVERGAGDVALELEIIGAEEQIHIDTEYQIRKALGNTDYTISLNDGSETSGRELLPSAFFEIEYEKGEYTINGGGFGHGIGMSQNGANEMAKQGVEYEEILEFFYSGVTIS